MAAKIPGRLPRKEDLETVKQMDKYLLDIGTKLSRLASGSFPTFEKSVRSFIAARTAAEDLQKQLNKLAKEQKKLSDAELRTIQNVRRAQAQVNAGAQNMRKELAAQKKKLEELRDASSDVQDMITKTDKNLSKLSTGFVGLVKVVGVGLVNSLESVLRSIAKIGIDTLSFSFKKLEDGVQRVYELFERWTKALGAFNMQLGGISPNIDGAIKQGKKWESEIRGLTDHFGEGLQMYSEFVTGFGRMLPEEEAEKWGKMGIVMARGIGMGAQAAGEFMRAAYQMGETPDDMKKTFGMISSGATAAGVSVNKFAQELNGSRDFMTGFGKEGKKLFIEAASYARKLGVSLKSLQQFTKITDTFESAVGMASKLNTIFGTNINSLQLMLEQDPSKRLEMVRQEMLAQGKTFDQMSRQERAFFAEQMNLTQEEIAGTLQRGLTLDQFHQEQEKARKKQLSEDQLMRKSQLATAQTMFAFGAAADKITMALVGLLDPFLKIIGLTGKNTSFNAFFRDATDKIVGFINAVAKDPTWIEVMNDASETFKKVGSSIVKYLLSDKFREKFMKLTRVAKQFFDMAATGFKKAFEYITSDQGSKMIDKLVYGFSKLVEYSPQLLELFLAMKAIQTISMLGGAVSSGVGLAGMIGNLGGAVGGATQSLGGMAAKLLGTTAALGAAATAGYAFGTWLNEYKWSLDGKNKTSLGEDIQSTLDARANQKAGLERHKLNTSGNTQAIFESGKMTEEQATKLLANIVDVKNKNADLTQKEIVASLDLLNATNNKIGALAVVARQNNTFGKGKNLEEIMTILADTYDTVNPRTHKSLAPDAPKASKIVPVPPVASPSPVVAQTSSSGTTSTPTKVKTGNGSSGGSKEITVNIDLNMDSDVIARKIVMLSTEP